MTVGRLLETLVAAVVLTRSVQTAALMVATAALVRHPASRDLLLPALVAAVVDRKAAQPVRVAQVEAEQEQLTTPQQQQAPQTQVVVVVVVAMHLVRVALAATVVLVLSLSVLHAP
jgi:hypothetical protein